MGNACRGSGEDGTLFVLGLIICVIMDVDLWGSSTTAVDVRVSENTGTYMAFKMLVHNIDKRVFAQLDDSPRLAATGC